MQEKREMEIWGGVDGTLNRVGNAYHDQLDYAGHYQRESDIDLIASLGIKMLRYPIIWEKHQPEKDTIIDWSFAERNLTRLKTLEVEPIVGLVHHGSGPAFVNFFDGSFEEGLANYARTLAEQFPWLQYYTPVNEPLTTARFCGLYGHWYPHKKDDLSFYQILLSECKATVMAMQAIREINPNAKLVQTEDLGKTYSTLPLKYQATFENHRRWLSYDLLCGKVNAEHPLRNYLTKHIGITVDALNYFLNNPCIPDICGFNYYITSERYLDHNISKYPEHRHGSNGKHTYADVEAVRVAANVKRGPSVLLQEAYEHLQLPIAVTECHLHCTREEQIRWFNEMWQCVNKLNEQGVDIRAVTVWAIFGLYGWNKLVTEPGGAYEPGVFNLSTGCPKPTALARLIQVLTKHKVYYHPVLETDGWWNRDSRIHYPRPVLTSSKKKQLTASCKPLLIVAAESDLSTVFSDACNVRNIHHLVVSSTDVNMQDENTCKQLIQELHPWAIINISNNIPIDSDFNNASKKGAITLATICKQHDIRLVNIGCDVNDGKSKNTQLSTAYYPTDFSTEKEMLDSNPDVLIIKTGHLFGTTDSQDFISNVISNLQNNQQVLASYNDYAAFSYIPDVVQETLNMLLDHEQGIYYLSNYGNANKASIAMKIADMIGAEKTLIQFNTINQSAAYRNRLICMLPKERRIHLQPLDDALKDYFEHYDISIQPAVAMAV